MSEQATHCGCWKCYEARGEQIMFMIVCETCGNKRCPHAADHDLDCTDSNETGQPGSAYEHGSGVATARRMKTPVSGRVGVEQTPDIEAIAGILEEHQTGDYTHLFFDDPGSIDPPVGCRCGWRRRGQTHEAHVAELIAARTSTAAADTGLREWVRSLPDKIREYADIFDGQQREDIARAATFVECALPFGIDATAAPTTDTGARDE